jgi:hypothetical protein
MIGRWNAQAAAIRCGSHDQFSGWDFPISARSSARAVALCRPRPPKPRFWNRRNYSGQSEDVEDPEHLGTGRTLTDARRADVLQGMVVQTT